MRASAASCLAILLLAGCGADGARQPAARTPAAQAKTADAGVTEGRTGAATRAASGEALRRLAAGGRIAPGVPRASERRREGVGAGAACAGVDQLPAAANLPQIGEATLCLINGERADRGLATLAPEAQLARAALVHAHDMVAHAYFSHTSRNGDTMTDRIAATGYLPSDAPWVIGENLAWGTGALATPRAIVDAWLASPGHRANMLDARYREIGLGIALGNPTGTDAGGTYVTEFGARGRTTSTAPAPAGSVETTVGRRGERPTPRQLRRLRRSCRKLPPRRARRCHARVSRLARAARRARIALR